MSHVTVRTFVSGAFGQNAYLLWRDSDTFALAIDPGAEAEAMADELSEEGRFLEAILLTHAHIDHIEGVARLQGRTGAPVHLHPGDLPLYQRVAEQAAAFGLHVDVLPPVDHDLSDGQELRFGDIVLEVRHVPGHSPGHVLFYLRPEATAFVGDIVFQGSIGRTDLPGGNATQLLRGIRERVLTLPEETTLLPGHGPATTVARERALNPFLTSDFGGRLA